ncbi:hypothetical protein [uncultured Fibrella sp.]
MGEICGLPKQEAITKLKEMAAEQNCLLGTYADSFHPQARPTDLHI